MSRLTWTRSRLAVRTATLAISVALLAGLAFLDLPEAAAAPSGRCDKVYGTPTTPPPQTDLPGYNGRDRTPDAERYVYDYDNPSLGYDGLELPASQRELKKYGTDPKKWKGNLRAQIYAHGTATRPAPSRGPRATSKGG
ncbi:MAG: hypothetical protein ACRDT6_16045 [Micromonosporaceae bacterium]